MAEALEEWAPRTTFGSGRLEASYCKCPKVLNPEA